MAGVILGAVAIAAAAAMGLQALRPGTADNESASGGRTPTLTAQSPVINPDGSISVPNRVPPSVATDPPSTVTAPPPDNRNPRTVDVVQTYVDWDPTSGVFAAGYVAQTVEQGGTCTLTLTRGDDEVSATVPGEPAASSVACGGLTVPARQLGPGTWTSVVSYSSGTSEGESRAMEVEVP